MTLLSRLVEVISDVLPLSLDKIEGLSTNERTFVIGLGSSLPHTLTGTQGELEAS